MKRQCYNPYLPSWEYIPDAEPRVFGQRLYIYGSHDLFGAKEYCEGDYVCWSTPVEDLSDWRYEGVIFKKQDTPWNKENLLPAGQMTMWPSPAFSASDEKRAAPSAESWAASL